MARNNNKKQQQIHYKQNKTENPNCYLLEGNGEGRGANWVKGSGRYRLSVLELVSHGVEGHSRGDMVSGIVWCQIGATLVMENHLCKWMSVENQSSNTCME